MCVLCPFCRRPLFLLKNVRDVLSSVSSEEAFLRVRRMVERVVAKWLVRRLISFIFIDYL